MASKFERLAGKEEVGDGRSWDRYGFSEFEWTAMSTEQREVHYRRQIKCEHPYQYSGPSWSAGTNLESLRTANSHDPYSYTSHMIPCQRWNIKPPERWAIECDCQMCLGNIGLTEDQRPRRVNEEAVRNKLRVKLGLL